MTLINEFFSGHFIWCLMVNSVVYKKNLKGGGIGGGGGGGGH